MTPLKPCPFCLTEGATLVELWNSFDAGHIAHIHCEHWRRERPERVWRDGRASDERRATRRITEPATVRSLPSSPTARGSGSE